MSVKNRDFNKNVLCGVDPKKGFYSIRAVIAASLISPYNNYNHTHKHMAYCCAYRE